MNLDLRKLGQMTYVLLVCNDEWRQSFMVIIDEREFKSLLIQYLFREVEPDHYRFVGFL